MQGFYIANGVPVSKKDFPDFLTEFKTELLGDFLVSIWQNKHHLSYYEEDTNFIANNGVFVYKDRFNSEALELFYKDLSFRRLEDLLLEVRGQFVLIIYEREELIVATDKYRTIPVYRYKYEDRFAISNIYYLLTRSKDKTINKTTLSQRVSFGWDYPIKTGGTLFKEIEILKPGTIYNLTNNAEKQYWSFKEIEFGKYRDFDTLVDDLEKEVKKIYKFFDSFEGIACDLTGGMDTRLNVEMFCDRRDVIYLNDMNIYDRHLKIGGRYSEANIMKKILEKLYIPYSNLMGQEFKFEKWKEDNKEMLLKSITCPVLNPKRFYHYYQMSQLESRNIGVSGYNGTELMTGTLYHLNRALLSFEGADYINKWQPFVDIVDDIKEKDYVLSILTYIWEEIDKVDGYEFGFFNFNKYYAYFIYLTTYMESQAEYWGNINILMPMYSPYLDLIPILLAVPMSMKGSYKTQRFLYDRIMRKELREVNTTHGFPSCGITKRNFYRFLRLSSNNLQYHSIKDRIKQSIMDKMTYHSPQCKGLLKFLSRFSQRDFSFLDRTLSSGYINQEKFNKVLIRKQLIDWIKRLDKQLEIYTK